MGVSIANIALRGISMSGRFVLLIALAAYCTPAELGIFALFSAAAQWGVYLQGLEFHLFNARALVSADAATRARRTRDAFALYATVFAGSALVWLAVFAADLLPLSLLGWFLAILALEHAAQELYRLLNAFERPIAGTVVMFARTGAWNYVIAAVLWLVPSARKLDTIWIGWVAGGTTSLLVAAAVLRVLPWRNLPAIDWAWLRSGIIVGLPLLAGSLAERGISLFDRWFVGFAHGETSLGIYGFFATLALAIPTLAESGIGVVFYPRLMRAAQQRDREAYRTALRRMWIAFGAYLALVVPAALVAFHVLVPHLRNGAYAGELPLFCVMLAVAVVMTCSAIPQYGLWSRNQDRSMMIIPIVGLSTAVMLDVALVPSHAAMGAALGQLGAAVVTFALRVRALAVAERHE